MNTKRMAMISVALAAALPCRAQWDAATARKSAESVRQALVTIEAVAKISAPGEGSSKREMSLEVNGVVVDPNGLAVLCLTDIDPSSLYAQLLGGEAGNIQSEVSNVRYLMDDGTEIPAKIVLRDKDQNLAFVRPVTKPATPMAAVDLKSGVTVDLMDEVLVVSRMGKVGSHGLRSRSDRLQAVIPKPRRRYIVNTIQLGSELGGCVITPDGKLVGTVSVKASRAPEGSSSAGMSANLAQVVVPAEDILEVAAQAPENAAPTPAPAVTKPAPTVKKPAPAAKPPVKKK